MKEHKRLRLCLQTADGRPMAGARVRISDAWGGFSLLLSSDEAGLTPYVDGLAEGCYALELCCIGRPLERPLYFLLQPQQQGLVEAIGEAARQRIAHACDTITLRAAEA